MDSSFGQENLRSFHDVCNKNSLDSIKQFVQQGYSVNSHADSSFGELSGYTPLHFAVKNGNTDAVIYLLKNGADIIEKSANGRTPVHLAYYASSEPLLLEIFEHSKINRYVNTDTADETGLTHFHICCALKSVWAPSIIRGFIRKGADINGKTVLGFTPLYYAFKHSGYIHDNSIAKLLLENGADHSLRYEGGMTVLHIVCEMNALLAKESFLKYGPDFMAKDDKNRLPLHCMFYTNYKSRLANFLFDNTSTDCNHADSQGLSVLHIACLCEKIGIVKRLLAQGCCPNGRINVIHKNSNKTLLAGRLSLAGLTPLHMAMCITNCEIIEELLSAGADINAEDDKGNTPLWYYHNSFFVNLTNIAMISHLDLIISNHIIALQAAGLHVSEKIKSEFSKRPKPGLRCRTLYDLSMCTSELEKMQRVIISDCADESNNLCSILHKNEIEMVRLLSNENVKNFFNTNYLDGLAKEFRIYGYMIRIRVNKGLIRSARIETLSKAKDALDCLAAFHVPDLCSERIFSYLNNDDLKILIDASTVVQKKIANILTSENL